MRDHNAEEQEPGVPAPAGRSTLAADYASAAIAAAEAIAAEAAAAVTAEAASTAAAAVATALTAAIKAAATAELVASDAAAAATVATLLMPATSPPGAQQGADDDHLATAARSRASTVEVAAALAVATVAADVAQAAAAAAIAAAQAVRLVEARLLAGTGDGSAIDERGAGARGSAAAEPGQSAEQPPGDAGPLRTDHEAPWFAGPVARGRGLAVGGGLDVATARALAAAFADRPNDYSLTATYTLDLSALTFLDLRGLRAIADLHAAVLAAGHTLVITPALAPSVTQTLAVAARHGWWEPTVQALTAGLPAVGTVPANAERRRPSRSAAVDRAAAAADRSAASLARAAAERLGIAAAATFRRTQNDRSIAAEPGIGRTNAALERLAQERDASAAARDTIADTREATATAAALGLEAHDRALAAADRSATVADQHALAVRDAAALARDTAAARRDRTAATGDGAGKTWRNRAAADRAKAAADRTASAARNDAARARDTAAQARDDARASEAAKGRHQTQASGDRQASAKDRLAAAADRHHAAATLARAYRDELTGALRRDLGIEQLGHAVDRGHRGESLVVAFIDVDHLKWFNDTRGHQAGDNILAEVGRVLAEGLRSYDVVVRYGGDEFICAMPGSHLAEAKQRFAAIAETLAASGLGASVTVGFAELTSQDTFEQILARADEDMYKRKRRDAR